MKLGINYVLIGIAIASILGAYAVTTTTTTTLSTSTVSEHTPYLIGHITMLHQDSDGNIMSYKQTT